MLRMIKTVSRIAIVAAVNLVTFELLMQLSVDWPESKGELWLIAQMFLLILGIIWSVLPAFSHFQSWAWRMVAATLSVVLLFVGFQSATYYYSWHIRPNVGLYEEAQWVSKHPGFQKQLRAKIENNLWRIKK
jgi:hypothetical protein